MSVLKRCAVPMRNRIPYNSEMSRRIMRKSVTNTDAWIFETDTHGILLGIMHRRGCAQEYAWFMLWRVVPAIGTRRGKIVRALTLRRWHGKLPADARERHINGRWAAGNCGVHAWQDLFLREIQPHLEWTLPGTVPGKSIRAHMIRTVDDCPDPLAGLINHYTPPRPYKPRAKRAAGPFDNSPI